MGVPNTTTFTLQNVVDVVDNDDNLVGVFNDAVASKFDSAYSGAKNNLLNFRNYDSTSGYFSFNATLGTSPSGQSVLVYTTVINFANIALGDTLYQNSSGTVYASTTFSIHSSTQQPKFNCSGSQVAIFTTGSNGVIKSQSCGSP